MADPFLAQKRCRHCGKTKAADEFAIVKKTGLRHTYCIPCKSERDGEYRRKRKANPRRIAVLEQTCTTCGMTKSATEFSPHVLSKTGIRTTCKVCNSNDVARRYAEDPSGRRACYVQNREKAIRYSLEYNKRPERRAYAVAWVKRQYATNPTYMLKHSMRCAMRACLKLDWSGSKWMDLVPYSVDELKAHLLKTVPAGYAWGDFLSGELQIDHIVPVSKFNIKSATDIDFQRCWALENLRIIPKQENIRKGTKISEPFQPSLSGI